MNKQITPEIQKLFHEDFNDFLYKWYEKGYNSKEIAELQLHDRARSICTEIIESNKEEIDQLFCLHDYVVNLNHFYFYNFKMLKQEEKEKENA